MGTSTHRVMNNHALTGYAMAMVNREGYSLPQWFVVATRPGLEFRAQIEIDCLGYRTFLPCFTRWVSHARTRRKVKRPLMTNYLFAEVEYPRQSFSPIMSSPSISTILSAQGEPAPIAAEFVEEFIRRYLLGEWDFASKERLPLGAKILIVGGEYEDEFATITHMKGHTVVAKLLKSNKRVTLHDGNVRAAA